MRAPVARLEYDPMRLRTSHHALKGAGYSSLLRDEASARCRLLSLYARAVAGLDGAAPASDDAAPPPALSEPAAPPGARPSCIARIALGACTLDDDDAAALALALKGCRHV